MGVLNDVAKIAVHKRFTACKSNAFSALLTEIGEDVAPFFFGQFIVERFAGTHETMLTT